jgi:hypothetical protein
VDVSNELFHFPPRRSDLAVCCGAC